MPRLFLLRCVHFRVHAGFGFLLGLLIACATPTSSALAQPTQALIESPSDATVIRVRWPETSLALKRTGGLIAVSNALGTPLPFSLTIAPEDQGHTVRPMWLIIQLDGNGPYRLSVGHDLDGRYDDDPDTVVGRHAWSLSALPIVAIRVDAWGPILSTLDDAQAAQQSTESGWRRWIMALAVIGVALLAAIIAMFARSQPHRNDVGKL